MLLKETRKDSWKIIWEGCLIWCGREREGGGRLVFPLPERERESKGERGDG